MSAHDHRIPTAPITGAIATIALGGYLLPGLAAALPALRRPLGVEDRAADGRGYALTFDDGPHAQGTPAVLELLAQARVHATFFLVGEQIARNPVAARRDRRRRARRRPALRAPSQPAAADARGRRARTSRVREVAIEESTGVSPTLYRPPYGVLNAAALRHRARARLADAAVEPVGARLGAAARRQSRSPRA